MAAITAPEWQKNELRCPISTGNLVALHGESGGSAHVTTFTVASEFRLNIKTKYDWIPDRQMLTHLEKMVEYLVGVSFVHDVNSPIPAPPLQLLGILKEFKRGGGQSLLSQLHQWLNYTRSNMHVEQKELRKRMIQALGEMESTMELQAATETARKQENDIQNLFNESELGADDTGLIGDDSSGDLILQVPLQ